MPSVGMRRSTRVVGARTLRSGKRFSTESREGNKNTRASNKENESDKIVVNFADRITRSAGKWYKDLRQQTQDRAVMDISRDPIEEIVPDAAEEVPDAAKEVPDAAEEVSGAAKEVKSKEQMCGIVYQRKRKKAEFPDYTGLSEDKRYGKQFVRKRLKKNYSDSEALEIFGGSKGSFSRSRKLSIVAYRSSSDSSYWITCFLTSVLSYMTKPGLRMRKLSAFVLSKPFFDAYHSHGVLFQQGSVPPFKNLGVCMISGSRSLTPLIHVDASAIPCFFRYMHTDLWFRSLDVSCLFLQQQWVADGKGEEVVDFMDDNTTEPFLIASNRDHPDIREMVSPSSRDGDRIVSKFVVSPSDTRKKEVLRSASFLRTGSLTMQLRSTHNSNSKKIRKRRSSLRHKQKRGQSSKAIEALVADFVRIRGDSQSPVAAPPCEPKDLDKSCSVIQELKANMGEMLEQGQVKSSCTADILITEADRCYRVVGAMISLKQSDSDKWSIVIIKDGIERWDLTPEKSMKAASFNRITHATQWASDVGWRVEFPNKPDWWTFRDLYNECFERNSQYIPAPVPSVIPVPGVHVVGPCSYKDSLPYVRPDPYISMKTDELTRAMERETANYDMDSGDEEWLRRFNDEVSVNSNVLQERITPDRFELIIDSLEKSIQFADTECSHLQATDDICAHAGVKDVLEPIRIYWAKKRKQRHLGLLKIFQLYKPRRTPMIPNVVLRKKRSFKHPSNQKGRGKQRNILQAISFQREAMELRKHNLHKVQEAKAVADRSEDLAIEKRCRAQILTENADLATYKAVIALRIAEAAQSSGSVHTVAPFFLAN